MLADGFSCRTQVNQGTGVEALHLAQVLRRALDIEAAAPAAGAALPLLAAPAAGCCGSADSPARGCGCSAAGEHAGGCGGICGG